MRLSIFAFFAASNAGPTVGLGLRRRVRWVTETGVPSMLRYVDQGDASVVKEMRQRRDASIQDIKSAQEYRRYEVD